MSKIPLHSAGRGKGSSCCRKNSTTSACARHIFLCARDLICIGRCYADTKYVCVHVVCVCVSGEKIVQVLGQRAAESSRVASDVSKRYQQSTVLAIY